MKIARNQPLQLQNSKKISSKADFVPETEAIHFQNWSDLVMNSFKYWPQAFFIMLGLQVTRIHSTKEPNYRQLTTDEKANIKALLVDGYTYHAVAKEIGHAVSRHTDRVGSATTPAWEMKPVIKCHPPVIQSPQMSSNVIKGAAFLIFCFRRSWEGKNPASAASFLPLPTLLKVVEIILTTRDDIWRQVPRRR